MILSYMCTGYIEQNVWDISDKKGRTSVMFNKKSILTLNVEESIVSWTLGVINGVSPSPIQIGPKPIFFYIDISGSIKDKKHAKEQKYNEATSQTYSLIRDIIP